MAGRGRRRNMREIRCPGCGRLLGMEHDNGLIESRGRRQAVWTERAVLCCLGCGREVLAKPGHKETPPTENG